MPRRGRKCARIVDSPPEYENPMTLGTEHTGQSTNLPECGEIEKARDRDNEMGGLPPPPAKPDLARRVTRHMGRRSNDPSTVTPPTRVSNIQRSKRVSKTVSDGEDETSLFFVLRNNKHSINIIVSKWIESYKLNKEAALCQLMQFFISASGSKKKITSKKDQMGCAIRIGNMTDGIDENGEYPLIMKGWKWKNFQEDFIDFIQTLVKMCQESIIYDQFFLDKITFLLINLTNSHVRCFRHTATFAVMKLMTALVNVALIESSNSNNYLRQYEANKQKAQTTSESRALELLFSKRQKSEDNVTKIKNMLSYMFNSVFVHRYRDVLVEIRVITVVEIGIWMKKFPEYFLDDLYLKYIGEILYDKAAKVRIKCVQALTLLYSCENLTEKLELFTSKFKNRILSMTLQNQIVIAAEAVKLLNSILKSYNGMLTDNDCEHIYEMVFSPQRPVAQAAGEFVKIKLLMMVGDAPILKTKSGKERCPNTPLIRDLIEFFIESKLLGHAAYLVDSMIESNPIMKDWECMTDLLLEEAGEEEEVLDNIQKSSLIKLMVCCVRQAVTGESPVGRSMQRKKSQTQRELWKIFEEKQKMSVHFIQTLPALLEKYSRDADNLANLVVIPQYFDLETFTTLKQGNKLKELLAKLIDIVSIQSETEVLEACSKTLEILCMEKTTVYTECNHTRSMIIELCVNHYKEAIGAWQNLLDKREEPDADQTFKLENSLKRLSIMYACNNLNQTNIGDSLFDTFPKYLLLSQFPIQALIYYIQCCFTSVIWGLSDLESKPRNYQSIEFLKDYLHSYIKQCKNIIDRGYENSLKEKAYSSICNILVYFSYKLDTVHHKDEPDIKMLVYKPSTELRDLLEIFLQQFVFVQQNDDHVLDEVDRRETKELQKRRIFLIEYCKLFIHGILPIEESINIFMHYDKYYDDYGDILKITLNKIHEINRINSAHMVVICLWQLFHKIIALSNGKVLKSMQEFTDLKELAKRFSLSFGSNVYKNREAILFLHVTGIKFAVSCWGSNEEDGSITPYRDPGSAPPYLIFLEFLSEFNNKLLKQDHRYLLSILDKHMSNGIPSLTKEDWHPLLLYRIALVQGTFVMMTYPTERGQCDDEDEEDVQHLAKIKDK